MNLTWIHYPLSRKPPEIVHQVVMAFEQAHLQFDSAKYTLMSNDVLAAVAPDLEAFDFKVERGKKSQERIGVPVLFGERGAVEKSFDADAHHLEKGFVLEVEPGRAVGNNQFLKDLFQASMVHGVTELGIAVRNLYKGGSCKSRDLERVRGFFDTLFASDRLKLSLSGVTNKGY